MTSWSRDCPVRALGPAKPFVQFNWRLGMAVTEGTLRIVGGVDTHKDLHVAAVVDEQDRVMETRSFATTRQGYRQMLAWMRSFGELQRIGIEFDRQLWRRSPPFHAASRDRGSRGHDARQAGSPPAWKERRSRCPERGPCRLCRPADRDAAKPRRVKNDGDGPVGFDTFLASVACTSQWPLISEARCWN